MSAAQSLMDAAKPAMALLERLGAPKHKLPFLAGCLAREFGPTPLAALEAMQSEDAAVLEREARRVLKGMA